jgi:hypothetical protein
MLPSNAPSVSIFEETTIGRPAGAARPAIGQARKATRKIAAKANAEALSRIAKNPSHER